MTRLVFAAVLLGAATAAALAAPVPVVPADPTKDRDGRPLPKGAIARLGSAAPRAPGAKPAADADADELKWVQFSAEGDVVTTYSKRAVTTWARTGERKFLDQPAQLLKAKIGSYRTNGPLAWVTQSAGEEGHRLVGWDVAKRAVAWELPLKNPPSRVLSHDGRRVYGVTLDAEGEWTVVVVDGPGKKVVATWPLEGALLSDREWVDVALSGDGKSLFVGSKRRVLVVDPETGKEKGRVKTGRIADVGYGRPSSSAVACSPDGSRLAVFVRHPDNNLDVSLATYDVKTGKALATHSLAPHIYNEMTFSPNGALVAVWKLANNEVRVCAAEGTAEPRVLDGGAQPTCAAFSPNGATLAVGYEDGTTLLWDLSAK